MTIRERQIVYAFALIENAKQTLGMARNFLGDFPYDNGRRNLLDDMTEALESIDKVRSTLDRAVDGVTDWKDMGYQYTLEGMRCFYGERIKTEKGRGGTK